MAPITTKKGDRGETSLFSGERVKKSSAVMELLGNLDELNSWLGLVKTFFSDNGFRERIQDIQIGIFGIASRSATTPDSEMFRNLPDFGADQIQRLETFQNHLLDKTAMPSTFIVPGANRESAFIDIARTVCRRSERSLVGLRDRHRRDLSAEITYLNRLSDVLYILARHCDKGTFQEKR